MTPEHFQYRTERDSLGTMDIPVDALSGIHTARALVNFDISGRPVARPVVHAMGTVKKACVLTNRELGYFSLSSHVLDALVDACDEMASGALDSHIVVDAFQGGAGTSTNMNVNEVLANRALQLVGMPLGTYTTLSPTDHVNLHQSTNDVFPTAVKLAILRLLSRLEDNIVTLQEAFQSLEMRFAQVVKIGRTQLQDAVYTTVGRTMGAFADALSRDRWRIYKCTERIRVVNLGGTAIGTGIGAPRAYIFAVVDNLRRLSEFPFARAENMVDCTQNADVFVEVSGMLKAHAVTLRKIAEDLRLMSSGPDAGLHEIVLPPRQAGSSIMPGKINPVIPEAVSSVSIQIQGNDMAIAMAASSGNLELNHHMPLIANNMVDSLVLLNGAVAALWKHCITGLDVNEAGCQRGQDGDVVTATALISVLGYEYVCRLAREAVSSGQSLYRIVLDKKVLSKRQLNELIAPEAVCRLGSPWRGNE